MPKSICSMNGRHWHFASQLLLVRDRITISATAITAIICTEVSMEKKSQVPYHFLTSKQSFQKTNTRDSGNLKQENCVQNS